MRDRRWRWPHRSSHLPCAGDRGGRLFPSDRLRVRARERRRIRARFRQPLIETLDAFIGAHRRLPARRLLEAPRVRHVVALVTRAPFFAAQLRPNAMQALDPVEQIDEADGVARSAADVERLAEDAPDGLFRE